MINGTSIKRHGNILALLAAGALTILGLSLYVFYAEPAFKELEQLESLNSQVTVDIDSGLFEKMQTDLANRKNEPALLNPSSPFN